MLLITSKSPHYTGPFLPVRPHLLPHDSSCCDPATQMSFLFSRAWQVGFVFYLLAFLSVFALVVASALNDFHLLTWLVPSYSLALVSNVTSSDRSFPTTLSSVMIYNIFQCISFIALTTIRVCFCYSYLFIYFGIVFSSQKA